MYELISGSGAERCEWYVCLWSCFCTMQPRFPALAQLCTQQQIPIPHLLTLAPQQLLLIKPIPIQKHSAPGGVLEGWCEYMSYAFMCVNLHCVSTDAAAMDSAHLVPYLQRCFAHYDAVKELFHEISHQECVSASSLEELRLLLGAPVCVPLPLLLHLLSRLPLPVLEDSVSASLPLLLASRLVSLAYDALSPTAEPKAPTALLALFASPGHVSTSFVPAEVVRDCNHQSDNTEALLGAMGCLSSVCDELLEVEASTAADELSSDAVVLLCRVFHFLAAALAHQTSFDAAIRLLAQQSDSPAVNGEQRQQQSVDECVALVYSRLVSRLHRVRDVNVASAALHLLMVLARGRHVVCHLATDCFQLLATVFTHNDIGASQATAALCAGLESSVSAGSLLCSAGVPLGCERRFLTSRIQLWSICKLDPKRPECSYLHFLYAGLALGSVAQARACILHLLTALVQLMEDNDDSHLPVPVPALALINAQDTTLALAAALSLSLMRSKVISKPVRSGALTEFLECLSLVHWLLELVISSSASSESSDQRRSSSVGPLSLSRERFSSSLQQSCMVLLHCLPPIIERCLSAHQQKDSSVTADSIHQLLHFSSLTVQMCRELRDCMLSCRLGSQGGSRKKTSNKRSLSRFTSKIESTAQIVGELQSTYEPVPCNHARLHSDTRLQMANCIQRYRDSLSQATSVQQEEEAPMVDNYDETTKTLSFLAGFQQNDYEDDDADQEDDAAFFSRFHAVQDVLNEGSDTEASEDSRGKKKRIRRA